jgi:hypothetical protein
MTRRYVNLQDSNSFTEADFRVREQIEQDDLYREVGYTLDLLKTAMRQAGGDDVSEETRAALDQAEIALVDALVSRCEDVEEQLPQEPDA